MRRGGRPTRKQAQLLDEVSEQILIAYFAGDETTQEIADRYKISLRSMYRRIDRAQKNRRKAARADALARMEIAA